MSDSSRKSKKNSLRSHTTTDISPIPKAIPFFNNLCLDFNDLPFPNGEAIKLEKPQIMKEMNLEKLAELSIILKFQIHTLLEERNSLKKENNELQQKLSGSSNSQLEIATANNLEKIIRKVDSVETKLKFLATCGNLEIPQKSYATVAKTKLPSKAEKVMIVRQAIHEEKLRKLNENSIVLSNVLTENGDTLIKSICETAGIQTSEVTHNFIGKNNENPLKNMVIKMDYKEHVEQVKKAFLVLKSSDESKLYEKISMRPFYSKSELELYHQLWTEAKELNNNANSYQWTVRNLRLIKLTTPKKWINTSKLPNLNILFVSK